MKNDKDDFVVGLNQAEAGALLAWIEGASDYSLEDAESTFHAHEEPETADCDEVKADWYIGRVVAKLRRVLPTLYYFIKMPDSIEAKEMVGPFATRESRDQNLFDTALHYNWIGAAKVDMPLYSSNTGPRIEYVTRGQLEAVWREKNLKFLSMFFGDEDQGTTAYNLPESLKVNDDELREFVMGDGPEDYDEDFYSTPF